VPQFLPTHLRERVDADRAAADLRRHLPAIVRRRDGAGMIVFPAEFASDDAWRRLAALGPPALLVTQERAAVLKIRHKGRTAVRLSPPPGCRPAELRAIADPTLDLAQPLKGPFQTHDAKQTGLEDAALRLLRIAGLLPAALSVDIDDAARIAEAEGLLTADMDAVLAYEPKSDGLDIAADARLPLADAGPGRIVAFRTATGGVEHFAIVIGDPRPHDPVLTRLHSECFTGDCLGSLKCDCGPQLRRALTEIAAAGGGVLLYLAQEGRGIGLIAKLKAYALQDQGFDTVDANLRLGFAVDEREFAPAAAMLRRLGFEKVRLLTNNPKKVTGLEAAGITVTERVPHRAGAGAENAHYLATKRDRTGHFL